MNISTRAIENKFTATDRDSRKSRGMAFREASREVIPSGGNMEALACGAQSEKVKAAA